MKGLRQILAIARTEFRFGLRRGPSVVPVVLIGLVINVSVWIVTASEVKNFNSSMLYTLQNDPAILEKIQAAGIALPKLADEADFINTSGLMGSWTYFYILAGLLLVGAAAPAVPADRQFGVLELLCSLPLGGGRYLAGKLLGVGAAAVLVAVLPSLAYLASPLILVGAISFRLAVLLVLLDGLPVLVAALALGVLGGVPLGRRLPAVAFGFFAGLLGLAALILASKPNPYIGGGFLSPAAAYVLRLTDRSSMPHPPVSAGELAAFYLGALAVPSLLALLARAWLKWKENF